MISGSIQTYNRRELVGHIHGDKLVLQGKNELGAALLIAQASTITLSIHPGESEIIGCIICTQRQSVMHNTVIQFDIEVEHADEHTVAQIAYLRVLELVYSIKTRVEISRVPGSKVRFMLAKNTILNVPVCLLETTEDIVSEGTLIFAIFGNSGYGALLTLQGKQVQNWIVAPIEYEPALQGIRQASLLLNCDDYISRDHHYIKEILMINTTKVNILNAQQILLQMAERPKSPPANSV